MDAALLERQYFDLEKELNFSMANAFMHSRFNFASYCKTHDRHRSVLAWESRNERSGVSVIYKRFCAPAKRTESKAMKPFRHVFY
jgi:hypothetical protein